MWLIFISLTSFTEVFPFTGLGLWGVSRALRTKSHCSHAITSSPTILPTYGHFFKWNFVHPYFSLVPRTPMFLHISTHSIQMCLQNLTENEVNFCFCQKQQYIFLNIYRQHNCNILVFIMATGFGLYFDHHSGPLHLKLFNTKCSTLIL